MGIKIEITGETAPEALKNFRELFVGTMNMGGQMTALAAAATGAAPAAEKPAAAAAAKAEEPAKGKKAEKEKPAKEEKAGLSLEDCRAKLRELGTFVTPEECAEMIKKLGVGGLKDLPEAKYQDWITMADERIASAKKAKELE